MSCSSEEISSSSRSGNSIREQSRSAARCVATACRRKRSGAASHSGRALEEVEGLGGADQRLDAGGREDLDRLRDAAHPPAAVGALVGEPHDGDHERHVGLDRGRPSRSTEGWSWLTSAQDSLARLGQRRECLERLEGRRQPAPVALVVLPGLPGSAVGWRRPVECRPPELRFLRASRFPAARVAIGNSRIGRNAPRG